MRIALYTMANKKRTFPLPWRVDQLSDSALAVRDANGTAIAYVYFSEGARLAAVAGSLSHEEAMRIAQWIARSPALADPGSNNTGV